MAKMKEYRNMEYVWEGRLTTEINKIHLTDTKRRV